MVSSGYEFYSYVYYDIVLTMLVRNQGFFCVGCPKLFPFHKRDSDLLLEAREDGNETVTPTTGMYPGRKQPNDQCINAWVRP
jgi:hypothetical protein